MRLIIAGSRYFNNKELLFKEVDKIMQPNTEIVSGGAKGADKLGELYAKEHNLKLTVFSADWDKYGKSAGPIRNEQMASYVTHCILFWDGKSKGSMSMRNLAKKYNLVLTEVLI